MNIINGIRSYIREDEPKITILQGKINILNYKDIGHFDSDKIIIKFLKNKIIINGSNLALAKLMNDEILITGAFNNIEFR